MVIILLAVVFLGGCFKFSDLGEKVDTAINSASEKYGEVSKEQAEGLLDWTKDKAKEMVKDLSQINMTEIDKWLEENDLNEYGDPLGTLYTGGTPLFDEITGEMKDKYEYILENNPKLVETLELDGGKSE